MSAAVSHQDDPGDDQAGEWTAACDGCCDMDDPAEMYLCGACEALLCPRCYGDPPGEVCEACGSGEHGASAVHVEDFWWWSHGRTKAVEDVVGLLLRELF